MTGSVLPPLVSHIFCNMMGIYGPGTASRRHPGHKLCELMTRSTLTAAISLTYLAGIAGFMWGLTKL